MNKLTFLKAVKNVQNVVVKHSPEILTGFGIAGMVTTTILAVKATPKALQLIEEEKQYREIDRENGVDECFAPEKISNLDAIKLCWKCYIPAAITGTASIICLISASSTHIRRNAALATAYKLSETALTEYKDKVVETIGEKKEQIVRDKVAEEKVKKNPVTKSEVIITGNGDTLCFDPMSGRYFQSNIEKIKRAENELNKRMLHSMFGYVSLNDFYDELNLPRTEVGDVLGWNTNKLIDMGISSQVTDDGRPSIVLDYYVRPDYDFDR